MLYYRTLEDINTLTIHLTEILNNFSCTTEEKLYYIESKVNRCRNTLKNIMHQLDISDTEIITDPDSSVINPPRHIQKEHEMNANGDSLPEIQETINDPIKFTNDSDEKKQEEEIDTEIESMNPLYSKYLVLLKHGVPIKAFEEKLKSDGLDPETLTYK